MEIRDLLKDYRLEQKKTKKAWAGNVITASYYARVEKGISRITAEDLLNLLDYNHIPLTEFFAKLKQEAIPLDDSYNRVNKQISQAYYSGSKKELQKLRKQIIDSNLPDRKGKILLVDVAIALVDDNFASLDSKEAAALKEKFFNIDEVTVENIDLYLNCMAWYDFGSNLTIAKRIVEHLINSDNSRLQIKVLSIAINMLFFCIKDNHYTDSAFFIEQAQSVTTTPENYYYKNVFNFFNNLINYHYDHQEDHLNTCRTIIANFSINGFHKYSKNLEEFLVANK